MKTSMKQIHELGGDGRFTWDTVVSTPHPESIPSSKEPEFPSELPPSVPLTPEEVIEVEIDQRS